MLSVTCTWHVKNQRIKDFSNFTFLLYTMGSTLFVSWSLLGNFSEKCILKLVELISGHCLTIKTASKRPFIGCALQILGFCSRCKLSASKFSACVESKILRQFWGLKVTHHWVLTSTFHFLYSSLLSLFLHCFFAICWSFTRLCFGWESFGKAFRILNVINQETLLA